CVLQRQSNVPFHNAGWFARSSQSLSTVRRFSSSLNIPIDSIVAIEFIVTVRTSTRAFSMSDPCNDGCQSAKVANVPASGIANTDTAFQHGYVSDYRVPKMDCPSEEGMIRMALDSIEPRVLLEFDTPNRKVRVFHGDNGATIEERMRSLGLGATLEKTTPVGEEDLVLAREKEEATAQVEAGILKWLLAINGVMFVVELTVGWLAQSTGLIADSLDMFADAAVYGVALYAVGHSVRMKLRAAHLSGWLQLILALGVLAEV